MYIKKTITSGDIVEVEKHFITRHGKGKRRASPTNPTPQDVEQINERNAEKKLRRLMNANFTKNDYHTVLTYRKEERLSITDSKKAISDFLKKLRAEYKKQGSELKYIVVTEYGTVANPKAIHHHLMINNIGIEHITKHWKYGKVNITPIYSEDLGELANYFVKETKLKNGATRQKGEKRWSSSRNLAKPIIKVEKIKANSWRDVPRPPKGYIMVADTLYNGVDIFGHITQTYTYKRIKKRC